MVEDKGAEAHRGQALSRYDQSPLNEGGIFSARLAVRRGVAWSVGGCAASLYAAINPDGEPNNVIHKSSQAD
jgi:hypothetical protein